MASNIMLTRCGFLFEAASLGIGSVLSVGCLLYTSDAADE